VVSQVGRSPWTADDALVGLHRSTEEPDQGSGADEGVRPTAIQGTSGASPQPQKRPAAGFVPQGDYAAFNGNRT
jgi:hypothetical protein